MRNNKHILIAYSTNKSSNCLLTNLFSMEKYGVATKIFVVLSFFTLLASARFLDELSSSDELPETSTPTGQLTTPPLTNPVGGQLTTPTTTTPGGTSTTAPLENPTASIDPHHTLTFFMHDILGGSNPSARAVTGIVSNPAVNGQLPFVKPNGANLPINNGVSQNSNNNGLINNNNIPFLTGLGGTTQAVMQNSGNNNNFNSVFNFPAATGGQLSSGSALQQLMYGTITVMDDELTQGIELGSGFLGKAQGFYVASSIDGASQTMAFTTMFRTGNYVDSLCFFGVHRNGVSESQLAIMGGTGKYVNAKGHAIVKTIPNGATQHDTDGVETVLEFSVYVSY